ncbi:ribonuclease H1-like [Musca autumnalis]|uniref:ribonuclease H1-like n=1 Tax=Musca autumnalis TaxID=221902 RepID=UPI003CEDD59C
MEDGTGAGVYCENPPIKQSFKLNDNCSVFLAEIFAIRKAVEMVKELESSLEGPVTIFVDSQAALKALKSWTISSKAILDCKNALLEVGDIVDLCWVPGHSDIAGNEEADKLALGGSQSIDLPVESSTRPPKCYYT